MITIVRAGIQRESMMNVIVHSFWF